MNNGDDLFTKMCREAQHELAKGDKSWKDVSTNTLFLACFGMMSNHLTKKLGRPLWLFASSIFAAVIGYLIHLALG